MPKNHDIVEISGFVHAETAAAYLFSDGTILKGKLLPEKVWLPKSQCEWSPAGGGLSGGMQMPEWLAMEKGFI